MSEDKKITVKMDVDVFINTMKKDPTHASDFEGSENWSNEKKIQVVQKMFDTHLPGKDEANTAPSSPKKPGG